MKNISMQVTLFIFFIISSFTIFPCNEALAFNAEMQEESLDSMLATPAGMLQNIPVCSKEFVKSLNKSNTVMWVNDPQYPGAKVPCCIKGLVCQPYPDYKNYVIAMPALQSEYDCSKIAKDCGYVPICQVVVGESLDPTTLCTACVPYRFRFWATVYQNKNAPAPPKPPVPPSPSPSDPCRGKICPGKTRCVNGHCVQVR